MNYKRFFIKISTAFLLLCITVLTQAQQLNRTYIYQALAGSSSAAIDAQLKELKSTSSNINTALEGALLMRKAGIVSIPAKKLSFFKQGHKKLEGAIVADKDNAEFRFLRLMIQENAPKSLGYNKNITEDSRMVKAHYKSLPAAVQKSVLFYSKKSKALPSSAL